MKKKCIDYANLMSLNDCIIGRYWEGCTIQDLTDFVADLTEIKKADARGFVEQILINSLKNKKRKGCL